MDSMTNGYTKIENKYMYMLFSGELTSREMRVFLFILRYTNGFNGRDSAELSARFIANGTGIDKRDIISTLQSLKDKKLIYYSGKRNGNKPRKIYVGGGKTPTTGGGKTPPKVVGKSPPKKRKNKDNLSSVDCLYDNNLESKEIDEWWKNEDFDDE